MLGHDGQLRSNAPPNGRPPRAACAGGEPGSTGAAAVPYPPTRAAATITHAVAEMSRSTRDELSEVLPRHDDAGSVLHACRAVDLAVLRRGVDVSLVCEESCFADPRLRTEIELRREAGARVRVTDRKVPWIRLSDRRAAVLPLSTDAEVCQALVVHERTAVAGLQELLTGTWRRAVDVGTISCLWQASPGRRDRQVLHLLGSGCTDEAAARSMDVSVRTYRRHVAELLAVLGASSRFEAGVMAVARGWLSAADWKPVLPPGPPVTGRVVTRPTSVRHYSRTRYSAS